ncbi:MAG: hypothetical protein ABI583_09835, partial [Betaproteobacteria bacterium]
ARENGRGVFFHAESVPEQAATLGPVGSTTPALQSVSTFSAVTTESVDQTVVADTAESGKPSPDKPKAPPRGKLRIVK